MIKSIIIIFCVTTILFWQGGKTNTLNNSKETSIAGNTIKGSSPAGSEEVNIDKQENDIDEAFKEVTEYLILNVPEINEFEKEINELSNGEVTLMIRIDRVPGQQSDSKYKDYYLIYVGENHDTYGVRWNSFYVRKDLKEILVDNVVTGEVISIEEWRKMKREGYY